MQTNMSIGTHPYVRGLALSGYPKPDDLNNTDNLHPTAVLPLDAFTSLHKHKPIRNPTLNPKPCGMCKARTGPRGRCERKAASSHCCHSWVVVWGLGNPAPLNPKALNPKPQTLNPETLNPKALNPILGFGGSVSDSQSQFRP